MNTPVNYNDKVFKAVENEGHGETSQETIFHYKQEGSMLHSEYSGGRIKFGQLIGLVDEAGIINLCYQQVNDKGELKTGTCTSTPEQLPNGKLRLHETWQWTCGDRASGKSILEEI